MNIFGTAREGQVGGLYMLSCSRELPMEVCLRLVTRECSAKNVKLVLWVSFHPVGHLGDFYSSLPRQATKPGTMNLKAKYKLNFFILQAFFWRQVSTSTFWDTKDSWFSFISPPLLSCSPNSAIMRQKAAKCLPCQNWFCSTGGVEQNR